MSDTTETVEQFRLRARDWLAQNMERIPADAPKETVFDKAFADENKRLQRKLFDGGFAGICYPREYGGQGLTRDYNQAFIEESLPYVMPVLFNSPTLNIIAPTILDLGTEAQRQRYLPALLRGDELWVQFMSEPSGGSDMAGAITTAHPDGNGWKLRGSKIWSSFASISDYALCLARTDWDQVKHAGLSMFMVKIDSPGVTVNPIVMSDKSCHFCQEFFDDVALDGDAVLGKVNDGWTVAQRLLHHERGATGGSSAYAGSAGRRAAAEGLSVLIDVVRRKGTGSDYKARQLVADAAVHEAVKTHLNNRIARGIGTGAIPSFGGAISRLFSATLVVRMHSTRLELAGADAVVWDEGEALMDWVGNAYLARQAACLGGGSTEMQRNLISERVLDMPRETQADKGLAFKDVRRNG